MNDNSIKVVKRNDLMKINEANILGTSVRKPLTSRESRREIVATISNWVTESRENSRAERVEALRKYFGRESVLGSL
jgi:hypothetical protein